jgi:LruC domain-containing protein
MAATNFAGSDLGNPGVYYLGAFNAKGVPAGMTSVPVGQPYLDNLALVLPEKNHLPCDPVRQALLADLFCNQVTTSKDDAEVAVTFLGEGAGYKNALAYYYYPAGSPPASRAAIDSVFVIFPNASTGGANMTAGDRVVIGTFPKNTTIEWVLLSDMWDGTSVHYAHTPSKTNFFFGDDAMNNDMGYNTGGCTPDPAFNQHMISFTDNLNGEDIQMFAFEDIRYPYGDYDFNDCIFYATGDLYPSCAPQLSVPTPGQSDSDGDGIIDQYDDEPNNPNVACLIEYDGTLLFEDLWPSKGDYDFNDLVTGYVITHAIHADGYVHEVRADYTAKAMGAGYNNGFGTVLSSDLVKADIASITGRSSTGGFPMDGDLTATPGSDLVMYNWDATKSIVSNDINGGAFFNTKVGGGKGNFVTENIVITMAPNAVDQWELGLPPYNPFIFADQDDTREIHLADMAPSSLNDNSRFGTANDDSDGISRFYKTASPANLPWALDIPAGAFEWPLERVDILTAYPNFGAWAMSGGMVNTDWYDFPAAGQTYTP